METAGNIIQSLCDYFVIDTLEAHAEFPDKFAEVEEICNEVRCCLIGKVDDLNNSPQACTSRFFYGRFTSKKSSLVGFDVRRTRSADHRSDGEADSPHGIGR